jgi:hypothetical protein
MAGGNGFVDFCADWKKGEGEPANAVNVRGSNRIAAISRVGRPGAASRSRVLAVMFPNVTLSGKALQLNVLRRLATHGDACRQRSLGLATAPPWCTGRNACSAYFQTPPISSHAPQAAEPFRAIDSHKLNRT